MIKHIAVVAFFAAARFVVAAPVKVELKDSMGQPVGTVYFNLLEVHAAGKIYPLTLMEASILRFLIEHEGQSVSRKSMLQEVWGMREDTDTRAIDNFIVRLRRYLEDDPANPRHLLTVRGIGYRFVASP